ncbi:MAG: uracil-DNA glycosylase family protein [Bauldia sp.]
MAGRRTVGGARAARDGEGLDTLLAGIRACRLCRDRPAGKRPLPHEPRPVLRVSPTATLCVAGQAPGTRVHESGTPFTDRSGDRLRDWMGIDSATFYDTSRVAVVPMGFCFPGQDAKGADLPPRGECAPLWHIRLFAALPNVQVVLALGLYAHAFHLGALNRGSLTDTVAAWREIGEATAARGRRVLPLPHPSWRNNAWIKKNPWFETELLPALRAEVARHLR